MLIGPLLPERRTPEPKNCARIQWPVLMFLTLKSLLTARFHSAQAGSIEDDEASTLKVTLDCGDGDVAFYHKVSSESGSDYLKFYIDGVKQGEWSGEENWAEVSFPVTAGTRTFEWTYSKDGSESVGDDTAWIDDIVFPVN